MTNWHPSFCWYELSVPVPDCARAPQTAECQTTRRVSALQDHPDYFLIFAGREDLMFREGQMQQFSHHQTMPTNSSDTPTSTAAVTMRLKTAECTTSRAACKLKNLLRLLAQLVMCDASAAVSVDTKSTVEKATDEGKRWGVMICSRHMKNSCFTPTCQLLVTRLHVGLCYAQTLGFYISLHCYFCRTGAISGHYQTPGN